MSELAASVAKFATQKLGEKAAKHIIEQHFSREQAKKWKKLFGLESSSDIEDQVKEIEHKLAQLKDIAENTEMASSFQHYNAAASELNRLIGDYLDQLMAHQPGTERRSYDNAVRNALNGTCGIYAQIGKMRNALLADTITQPGKPRSLLANYAAKLAQRYVGVLDYCSRLETVFDHYRHLSAAGIFVRNMAKLDAADSDISDVVRTREAFESDEALFQKTLHLQAKIRNKIVNLIQGSESWFRLESCQRRGTYLSIYREGLPTSPQAPFGDYKYDGVIDVREKNFMPQVFAAEAARGQERHFYTENLSTNYVGVTPVVGPAFTAAKTAFDIVDAAITKLDSGTFTAGSRTVFNMQRSSQEWRFADGFPRTDCVRLINRETGWALAGVHDDLLRIEPINSTSEDQLWEPILSQSANQTNDEAVLLLRHAKSGKVLDLDNMGRVYAKYPPDHREEYRKWRLA